MENDPIIWKCTSYKTISGGMNWFAQKVMFDDHVASERMNAYMKVMEERGVEKMIVKRVGTLSECLKRGFITIRPGATRISDEKKNHKLEDFLYG